MNTTGNYFAVAVPGTEPALLAELQELGIASAVPEHGGVAWSGPQDEAEQIAGRALTPTRILYRITDFPVSRFAELVRKTAGLPWEELLQQPGFSVRAVCHRSKLYHSSAVEQRVRAGIEQRLAATGSDALISPSSDPDTRAPDTRTMVVVRIDHNHCQLSITLGKADLYQRGYRLETAKAPLRENLAAVMLQLSGWEGHEPLYDPFCGSGTIPIEAALLSVRRKIPAPQIFASDRDAGACRITASNAERAGAAGLIHISNHAISDLRNEHGQAAHIVTNPPYGKRVNSRRDLRNLYARFGTVLRTSFAGSCLTMLCTTGTDGDILAGQLGIPLTTVASFSNGGLPVAVRRGAIPAEAM